MCFHSGNTECYPSTRLPRRHRDKHSMKVEQQSFEFLPSVDEKWSVADGTTTCRSSSRHRYPQLTTVIPTSSGNSGSKVCLFDSQVQWSVEQSNQWIESKRFVSKIRCCLCYRGSFVQKVHTLGSNRCVLCFVINSNLSLPLSCSVSFAWMFITAFCMQFNILDLSCSSVLNISFPTTSHISSSMSRVSPTFQPKLLIISSKMQHNTIDHLNVTSDLRFENVSSWRNTPRSNFISELEFTRCTIPNKSIVLHWSLISSILFNTGCVSRLSKSRMISSMASSLRSGYLELIAFICELIPILLFKFPDSILEFRHIWSKTDQLKATCLHHSTQLQHVFFFESCPSDTPCRPLLPLYHVLFRFKQLLCLIIIVITIILRWSEPWNNMPEQWSTNSCIYSNSNTNYDTANNDYRLFVKDDNNNL